VRLAPLPRSHLNWFLFFGLLCFHTASTPIKSGTHASGVQYEGSPQNVNRIERHSRNGPWTHENCFEVVYVYVGSFGIGIDTIITMMIIIITIMRKIFFSSPFLCVWSSLNVYVG